MIKIIIGTFSENIVSHINESLINLIAIFPSIKFLATINFLKIILKLTDVNYCFQLIYNFNINSLIFLIIFLYCCFLFINLYYTIVIFFIKKIQQLFIKIITLNLTNLKQMNLNLILNFNIKKFLIISGLYMSLIINLGIVFLLVNLCNLNELEFLNLKILFLINYNYYYLFILFYLYFYLHIILGLLNLFFDYFKDQTSNLILISLFFFNLINIELLIFLFNNYIFYFENF